ncbi:hypothetical protein [Lederbergia lenta]|nr:hypothetical protein [Lederbergia lenta]MEC2324826.1 hypothetical protein [Lederbergia lenta]
MMKSPKTELIFEEGFTIGNSERFEIIKKEQYVTGREQGLK